MKELLIKVPVEHPCFADHFPGNPLVPGALLLKWILARLASETAQTPVLIKQVKFLAAVLPGMELRVQVIAKAEGQFELNAFVDDAPVLKGSVQVGVSA